MNNKMVLVALAIFCCVASVACSFSSLLKFPRSEHAVAGRTRSAEMEEGLPYCYVGTCLGVGGNCSIPGAQCINSQAVTVVNYTTFDYTCTCEPLFAIGENCTFFSQCASDNCVGGVCRSTTYQSVSPGGSCSADTDCYNYKNPSASLTCNSGICSGGTSIGAACTSTSYCLNSFCAKSTSTCTAQIISGGACNSADQDNCLLGSCVNGACQNTAVVAIGANCSSSLCTDGAYCGANYECYPSSDYTYAACDSNNNCTNGQICTCNSLTGAGVCAAQTYGGSSTAYVNAINSAESCYFKNGCQNNNNGLCTACARQICQVLKTSFSLFVGYDPKTTASCIYNYYQSQASASQASALQQYNCNNLPNSASSVSVPLVLAAAASFLISAASF